MTQVQVKDDITLKCQRCDRLLLRVVVTHREGSPLNDMIWPIQAQCCYCDSKSKLLEIKGSYAYSGIEKHGVLITSVGDIEEQNNVTLFKMVKS